VPQPLGGQPDAFEDVKATPDPVGWKSAPPRASAMVEALRGLGYAVPTAIADILDNSITAGASTISVSFRWAGEQSSLVIHDDGRGMDADELEVAMRLGERNPLEKRAGDDLGRFGLGLKTASFSQCRRLTVISRRGGQTSAMTWDLDILASDPGGNWKLLAGIPSDLADLSEKLGRHSSGTMVVWQAMDRITPKGATDKDFLELIDGVEKHLAMVFHRYIENKRIQILINGQVVHPWDPFLTSRSETWRSGTDRFRSGPHPVSVEGFVLPHRDRLDAKTYKDAEGPDGWTAQQGFYVYRNERLLVAGSWLGLGRGRSWTKEEAFRLARIRLDLTNSSDMDWKIDIRKSTARPPADARLRLIALAESVRERARRVFAFRGPLAARDPATPIASVWRTEHRSGGVRYRIDCEHPLVTALLDQAGGMRPDFEALFRIIEETVPVQQIWLDTVEAKETPRTRFEGLPAPELLAVMQTLFQNLIKVKGVNPEEARRRLLRMEPFDAFPDAVAALVAREGD
jgi:hypothetical protein